MIETDESLRHTAKLLERLARWDALLGISDEHEAIAKAVAEERAAVVAWLRERAAVAERRDISVAASVLEEASDTIEAGEHRHEEER